MRTCFPFNLSNANAFDLPAVSQHGDRRIVVVNGTTIEAVYDQTSSYELGWHYEVEGYCEAEPAIVEFWPFVKIIKDRNPGLIAAAGIYEDIGRRNGHGVVENFADDGPGYQRIVAWANNLEAANAYYAAILNRKVEPKTHWGQPPTPRGSKSLNPVLEDLWLSERKFTELGKEVGAEPGVPARAFHCLSRAVDPSRSDDWRAAHPAFAKIRVAAPHIPFALNAADFVWLMLEAGIEDELLNHLTNFGSGCLKASTKIANHLHGRYNESS